MCSIFILLFLILTLAILIILLKLRIIMDYSFLKIPKIDKNIQRFLMGHDLSKMGQLLTEPNKDKHTTKIDTPKYSVGVSSMQGWRITMEDAHTVLPSLPDDEPPVASFFGVFDGHGGKKVSEYVSENLHKYLVKSLDYKSGAIEKSFQLIFEDLDKEMSESKEINEDMSGTTAVVVLIKNNVLYCANLGDSRAVAFVEENTLPLSEDHKPTLPIERERIIKAGGFVEQERINGSLALSRAFGDFQFKTDPKLRPCEQIVSSSPDVVVKSLNNNWKFVVIACDGIWECLTNDDVMKFVNRKLEDGFSPDSVCEQLMDKCLAREVEQYGPGADNMTVIIVVFKWEQGDYN